jgi:hypothetical protein
MNNLRVDLVVNAAAHTGAWPNNPTLSEIAALLHDRAGQFISYNVRLIGSDGTYAGWNADDNRTATGARDCASLLADLASVDGGHRFTVTDSNNMVVEFRARDIVAVHVTVGV